MTVKSAVCTAVRWASGTSKMKKPPSPRTTRSLEPSPYRISTEETPAAFTHHLAVSGSDRLAEYA
jgi:hypothetical protein